MGSEVRKKLRGKRQSSAPSSSTWSLSRATRRSADSNVVSSAVKATAPPSVAAFSLSCRAFLLASALLRSMAAVVAAMVPGQEDAVCVQLCCRTRGGTGVEVVLSDLGTWRLRANNHHHDPHHHHHPRATLRLVAGCV